MRRILSLLPATLLLLFVSCQESHKQVPVSLYRFEQLMFGTPVQELPQRLYDEAPHYHGTLLNVYPDDPRYMADIAGMAQDPILREIYDTISLQYSDLSWLQQELSEAMGRAQVLDSNIRIEKTITFISGLLDYTNRVAANENSILIAIDQYTVPSFAKYAYFDLPQYLVSLSTQEHIVPDAMSTIARNHIVMDETEAPMLLDYIIAEGKVLYFLDQVLPNTADTLKIRYTQAQWQWAEDNANQVWAYWLQHELLFERDHKKIFKFTDDAPKTNAFGESAPRMTAYIGWLIINRYMSNTNKDLHSLFNNPNSLEILKESGWKPKR